MQTTAANEEPTCKAMKAENKITEQENATLQQPTLVYHLKTRRKRGKATNNAQHREELEIHRSNSLRWPQGGPQR
jgi:hypothetical protein